jgi:hypothetical protein
MIKLTKTQTEALRTIAEAMENRQVITTREIRKGTATALKDRGLVRFHAMGAGIIDRPFRLTVRPAGLALLAELG